MPGSVGLVPCVGVAAAVGFAVGLPVARVVGVAASVVGTVVGPVVFGVEPVEFGVDAVDGAYLSVLVDRLPSVEPAVPESGSSVVGFVRFTLGM